MNTTAEASTHTIDQSRPQPLRRPTSDRMIAGVAAGIANYLGADVTIIRIVLAVLTFVGGAGVPIYLACWLLIPEPDVSTSALDRGVQQLRLHKVPPPRQTDPKRCWVAGQPCCAAASICLRRLRGRMSVQTSLI